MSNLTIAVAAVIIFAFLVWLWWNHQTHNIVGNFRCTNCGKCSVQVVDSPPGPQPTRSYTVHCSNPGG
jgi:hypothetical protein